MRYDIHPKEKKVLGHRFFLQAMDKVYGQRCLADAPELKETVVSGNQIQLTFYNVGNGLQLRSEFLSMIKVTGNAANIPVEWADVHGDSLLLTVQENLAGIVKISFARMPYYEMGLYNSAGIPAIPFSVTVEAKK